MSTFPNTPIDIPSAPSTDSSKKSSLQGAYNRRPLRVPSRSNSQIIQAFTLARQEMALEVDKRGLTRSAEQAAQRRLEREAKFGKVKARESKSDVNNALLGSEKYKRMDDHKIELADLYSRLNVDPEQGLSSGEAFERNKKHGDNAITEKQRTPWYINLLKQLTTLFACLLWVGATLSLIAYAVDTSDPSSLYLGVVLLIVNFLTGLVTYFQNEKSEAIVDAFKNFIPPKTKVLRGGNFTTIDAAKLVPGDIIELKGGDRIPADIRIIFAQEMKVDNSSLTGESDALLRTVECTNQENPLETDNLAFFGTLVKEGIGRGVVIQIGDNTVIGQIANLASSATSEETPLRKEINRFILIVITFAFSAGILFFILGVIIGYEIIVDVTFAIGILVASVPEGLLATVTAALTITAKRLATKKVLVKNLEAVETLGSTSCICSDKTGTLTQNKMTVQNLWYNDKIVRGLNYQRYGPDYAYEYDIKSSGFQALHENAIICSEAVFDNNVSLPKEVGENLPEDQEIIKRKFVQEVHAKKLEKKLWLDRPAIGDASETALIRFFQPIQDIGRTRESFAVKEMNDKSLAKIPFNSSWKYALTIVDYKTPDSDNCVFIKGAPERIWQLSTHVLVDDKPVLITEEWRKKFDKVNRTFGEGGERVLGFAKLHLPKHKYPADFQFNCKNIAHLNFPMTGFVFTGLVSLIDPPREVVPFSILKCKTAGIKVIMVTGDQPVTAAAIARQVNIFDKNEKTVNQIAEEKGVPFQEAFGLADAIVIHGDMITQATQDDELLPESERGKTIARWLQKPRIVFARTTPAQKLIIVKACQEQGHIVAVTGDGVNDSPAIKKADIGIAMGITGSDVAKDAADMILLTDDFSAIILGIEEGRKIFDNLKKSIIYCTSINIPQLIPFLTFIILGFPLPLTPILMLAIDLGTDVIPAIAFASEESELGIMLRPPRRKTEHMVTSKLLTSAYGIAGVFEAAGGFLTYFVIMRDFGFPLEELFGLMRHKGFFPNAGDVYDPLAPYSGSSSKLFTDYCNACWDDASKCDVKDLSDDRIDDTPDWLHNDDKNLDLRLYYLRCSNENGIKSIYSAVNFGECRVKQISLFSDAPVCFNTETLKFAQTGYFIAIVIAQISNAMSIKSRKFSFMFTGLKNFSLIFGFASEMCLTLILAFAEPLHHAFNTREVTFLHYGIPAIPFSVFALLYNEIRKFLIRNMPAKDYRKGNWFERNTYW